MTGMHDRAVYRADEIAEDAHGIRQPKGSSRLGKGQWMVLWREQPLPSLSAPGRVGFLGLGLVDLMVAQGITVARSRRVLSAVVKELLHGKYGVRCLWQRFCDQIGDREGVAAARSAVGKVRERLTRTRYNGSEAEGG